MSVLPGVIWFLGSKEYLRSFQEEQADQAVKSKVF